MTQNSSDWSESFLSKHEMFFFSKNTWKVIFYDGNQPFWAIVTLQPYKKIG